MKTMKNLSKRTLALLLALVLCLGMVNMTTFAAEAEHDHNPVDCATCGGTGKLTEISACPTCGGEIEMSTCAKCDGDGWLGTYVVDWDTPCPVNGEACNGCSECTMGYKKVLVTWDCDVCGGAGQVPAVTVETSTCDKCKGDGWLGKYVTDWDSPCPINGAACNGCSQCTMGYAKVLVTWDCDACGGWGTIVTASEGACETCGGRGQVKTTSDCTTCVGTGKVACTGSFEAGEPTKNEDGNGVMTYTCATCKASYTTSLTHEEVVAILGDKGHVKPAEGVDHKDATCTEEGYDQYACAVCGASVSVTIPAAKHNFSNSVCTSCGKMQAYVYGTYMARWYGKPEATADMTKMIVLDDLVGSPLTMENLGLDTNSGLWGQYVTNEETQKVWQCVGFIPITGNDADNLVGNVYTDVRDPGKFASGSLEAAQQYVFGKGGILYGSELTAETVAAWKGQLSSSGKVYNKGLMTVWFVADTSVKPGSLGEYNLTITPTAVPAMRDNSDGIEVRCSNLDDVTYVEADGGASGYYQVDLVVTIDPDAPANAHVNLCTGLNEAMGKINVGYNRFQPGDRIIINVSIDNRSGREYTYDRWSGIIATNLPQAEDGYASAGTGFDGFEIPANETGKKAYIPCRTNNAPLKALLGENVTDISDAAVGAALAELGYGKDTELSDEEVAKTYLADYYLDWTNGKRNALGEEPAHSFQDLTAGELSVFTNGSVKVQAYETCQSVAEALYYFYYGEVFTFNGTSIYDLMVQYGTGVSNMESAIPAALGGDDWDLNIAAVAGQEMNNAFSNTKFCFRIEFDLSAVPAPTPVIPTVTYYTLTVNYVYEDGTTAAETVTRDQLTAGTAYSVASPEIEGYTPDQSVVSGTMPSHDVVVTVVYTPVDETIEDEEPPLAEIPDEEPPLADLPKDPEEEIPDEEPPLADVPKTGDHTNRFLVMAAVSGMCLLTLLSGRKQRREDQ